MLTLGFFGLGGLLMGAFVFAVGFIALYSLLIIVFMVIPYHLKNKSNSNKMVDKRIEPTL
jgi:uncharacterized membrane protein